MEMGMCCVLPSKERMATTHTLARVSYRTVTPYLREGVLPLPQWQHIGNNTSEVAL